MDDLSIKLGSFSRLDVRLDGKLMSRTRLASLPQHRRSSPRRFLDIPSNNFDSGTLSIWSHIPLALGLRKARTQCPIPGPIRYEREATGNWACVRIRWRDQQLAGVISQDGNWRLKVTVACAVVIGWRSDAEVMVLFVRRMAPDVRVFPPTTLR
ncbi:hypothetical protein BCR34DRAFT_226895 [Clohesyomyces aquaticus]|uniref:Uncharacterized protein n=1 Tax=Clohesyomyces aquaticus TaxID=1231657 RepID=A0A1Y1Y9D2_9PLEO|nr:hypothetical protein BCR34DRAFT_226895 [Clohesyomyces aquaticus]